MHSVLKQVYIVSCKLLVSELRYDYNMSVSPIMSEYKWLKLLCLLIVSLKYLKYKCKKNAEIRFSRKRKYDIQGLIDNVCTNVLFIHIKCFTILPLFLRFLWKKCPCLINKSVIIFIKFKQDNFAFLSLLLNFIN